MFRLVSLVWLLMVVSSAYGLYLLKNEVEGIRIDLAETRGQIVAEKERRQVLSAEYAYLSRPDRLEQIARTHLSLQVMKPAQLAMLDDVPYPSFVPVPLAQKPEPPMLAPESSAEETPVADMAGAIRPASWSLGR